MRNETGVVSMGGGGPSVLVCLSEGGFIQGLRGPASLGPWGMVLGGNLEVNRRFVMPSVLHNTESIALFNYQIRVLFLTLIVLSGYCPSLM